MEMLRLVSNFSNWIRNDKFSYQDIFRLEQDCVRFAHHLEQYISEGRHSEDHFEEFSRRIQLLPDC